MEFYYPYQFKTRNDEQEMISMITTAKLTKNNNTTLTTNDIESMLRSFSSDIIILLWSSDNNRNIYDELILRLCQNNIVVVAQMDIIMNDTQTNCFMINVMNQLKNLCMVKFRMNIIITKITMIGHKVSCGYILNNTFPKSKNKIILIDPVLKSSRDFQKDNINILISSTTSYDENMRQKIETVTSNIYTLSGTDNSMIFASPTSDIILLNERSDHISRLVCLMNEIINN